MRRRTRYIAGATAVLGVLVYLFNASWLARPSTARVKVLAHRGLFQTSACGKLDYHTGCSAACIAPPTHDYLENTIPSMRAAFELGADVVELDIHPTTDGEFVVFHDWRLECRTNGSGVTREHTMAYLKTLDIGHGYTADGGMTFPFRGRAIDHMPTLSEVLDALPDRRLLIHIKGDDPSEADRLARALIERPAAQRRRWMVYGGERAVTRVLSLVPDLRGLTRASVESCALRYGLVGWTGSVPNVCRNTMLVLPERYAHLLWGWPHRFIRRMADVGTDVFLVRAGGGEGVQGIDSAEDLEKIARDNYGGGVWTDRIDVIGPRARSRAALAKAPAGY